MTELSLSPPTPLHERSQYVRHLEKLQERHERWLARVEQEKARKLRKQLQRTLGEIGFLASQSDKPLDSECTIVGYEPQSRHGNVIRTDHLAWDLGIDDDTAQPDTYTPHLYLARSNRHFYRGDQGRALPYMPTASADLLGRVIDLHSSFQQ